MTFLIVGLLSALPVHARAPQPNVILIMTDDQGYGDLGCHGNPILRTPHLDAMAKRSARWECFYVSPVCTPTRASLMTGRYNYRTRAIDTYRGRAMMAPEEVTIAESLRAAGYATGIFGKWHLGDCYPLRAIDQGFETALVHRGGGIGQPSDPPGSEGKYTDPVLFRNGRPEPHTGYCTDILFTEGMNWADRQRTEQRPFFLYLATNAPHGPWHDVPRDKLAWYQSQNITADRFSAQAGNEPGTVDANLLSRTWAMIENLDDNIGRLFTWLEENRLIDNTLVIFLTDNGPATAGWNAGLRGQKSEVFDGGIRSPAFFHWPSRFQAGPRTGRIAAHLDIAPTLLEICGVTPPEGIAMDGRSLLPALETGTADWPERTLFFQSHRGDLPYPRHQCAVRTERWKLVHPSGFGREKFEGEPKWQLFDMTVDPYEQHDQASQQPQIVADLQRRYDAWFADVSRSRPDNFAPPRILVGTDHEDPTILTRQDWRGADWRPNDLGYWLIAAENTGQHQVTVRFADAVSEGTVSLQIGEKVLSQPLKPGTHEVSFLEVLLTAGPHQVSGWIEHEGRKIGARFVEFRQRN